MPRNGSGSFVPLVNSWNPQTAGVSATPADFGAQLTDIAAGLTQSISADGQTAITGNIAMGGFKLTGLAAGSATGNSVRWEQLFSQGTEADIASASTCDIGGQNTNFLLVTGSTGITSFGTNYNGPRFLRFAGALPLTHNSTTLILPGAANITTAAGDVAIVVPKASAGTANGWQVFYQRAALAPGAASTLPVAVTASGLTMSTARMLGRTTAGTGAVEELTAANVAAFTAAATESAQGAVELATTAEAQAGTDTTRALVPARLKEAQINLRTMYTVSGSPTSIDFGDIPSWAKRVTIMLDGVSTNGTSNLIIQLGDAGGIENSGYEGGIQYPSTFTSNSSGFLINSSVAAVDFTYGVLTLSLMESPARWMASGNFASARGYTAAGKKALVSGPLTSVRLTTVGGVDAFDGGNVNVTWE